MPNNIGVFKQWMDVAPVHSDQLRFTKTKTFERSKHKETFIGILMCYSVTAIHTDFLDLLKHLNLGWNNLD